MPPIMSSAQTILRACAAVLALTLPCLALAADPPATTIQPRQFAAVAHNSAAKQYLLFGGTYGTVRYNDTWLLGTSGWTLQHPTVHPQARVSASVVYDSLHSEYVLFGGRVKNAAATACTGGVAPVGLTAELFCKDTWVFKNGNWALQTTATAPTNRELHAMAFDALTGQVVLFGGVGTASAAALGDTWVWNGTTWKQIATLHKPHARFLHSMAYDPVHKNIVMFGGDGGGTILNDTWIWNGVDWLPAPTQTTPPDFYTGAGLEFSSSLDKLVLFSGVTWNGARSGTPSYNSWSWSGTQWTKLPAASFQLLTNFSTLTAAQAANAVITSGTPTMIWVSH